MGLFDRARWRGYTAVGEWAGQSRGACLRVGVTRKVRTPQGRAPANRREGRPYGTVPQKRHRQGRQDSRALLQARQAWTRSRGALLGRQASW